MNTDTSYYDDLMTNLQVLEQELMVTLYSLDNLRRSLPPWEWKHFCITQTSNHPLHKLLLKDPFTRRAFKKPRGYAGDTVFLDYLYEYNCLPDKETNPIGEKIFNFTTNNDPAEALRYRTQFTAKMIDEMASGANAPISVLSIGAGHVREMDFSEAIQTQKIKTWIACDHDPENINLIKKEYAHLGIVAVQGSINEIVSNVYPFGKFDFIYATHSFEYLSRMEATQLIQWAFALLKPNGKLLVSNFRKEVPNTLFRTYMEAFMHWFLTYRTDAEIIDLFSGLNSDYIEKFTFSTDPRCNIAFALIKKR